MNILATLRTAAPFQTLRRREHPDAPPGLLVRRDDLRVTRYRRPTLTTTVFVVDASGSSARHRLAEAKGAVELVLAECYVRRDRVALIAFRGTQADLLLPPTASLVRAKRALAGLPGGGATPLAHGIDAARALADRLRRAGQRPVLVVLSDGGANIARSGQAGRAAARADALKAARALRADSVATLLIDTGPRPSAEARQLGEALGGRYLPLPYAEASHVADALRRAGTPAGYD